MNFSTVPHGGGGSLVTAMEVEGYSSFSWKTHIFEATEGAIMGMGAHAGAQKWWCEWGGALQALVSHFVAKKMGFFQ